jgi:hypothetical protein
MKMYSIPIYSPTNTEQDINRWLAVPCGYGNMTQDLKSSDINCSFWQGNNNLYIRWGCFLVLGGGEGEDVCDPEYTLAQFIPNT